ncbi:MAG: SPFH domain-containing protein [Candidatus Brocadiia bacterium]
MPGNEIPTTLILVLILVFIVLVMIITFINRYKRCPSNKIMVIYGKTGRGVARCVHGGAAFVWPVMQSYAWLELEPFVVPIELSSALSQENIRVSVPTTVTCAISTEEGIMQNAAIRLLGQTYTDIQKQAQDIILGQMRAVIATMKIEEINRDRQAFMYKVNEAVSAELEKIGLAVINVNIKDIEDESGYIQALGRKAAAEAINQALVDVAEQERRGKIGVAEREKDQRVAVAAANSLASIGESSADRDRRQKTAVLDAEAVRTETEANANKATYHAEQKVAEESARGKGSSAQVTADGQIRVSQENAQQKAEEARALREASRYRAEITVPAEAQKSRVVIEADAEREKRVLIARGDADAQVINAKAIGEATILKMEAEGRGIQAILDGKSAGYRALVAACVSDPQLLTSLLMIEKLTEVAHIQATAIKDLPIEKVIVWDGGGESGGMANLGKRFIGAVPPMHDIAKMVGLQLPEYLGKAVHEKHEVEGHKPEKK